MSKKKLYSADDLRWLTKQINDALVAVGKAPIVDTNSPYDTDLGELADTIEGAIQRAAGIKGA